MAVLQHSSVLPDSSSVHSEFRTLISGCGIYDLNSRVKIALTGEDRVRWLNGMVTNNVRDLPACHGVYAFLLNPQGRIQGDLYAFNRSINLLVDADVSQAAKILEIFDRYIIMDDVEVANVSNEFTAIKVIGPKARATLAGAGVAAPELDALQFTDVSCRDINLTLLRSDAFAVDSFELWIAPSARQAVWDALLQSAAKPVGAEAVELLRIASGVPIYGQDIRERDLPQETEQARALNFSKGCYIGQEIVERIRSRGSVHRMFTGFLVDGPVPEAGTKIQSEGKDVGEITSSAGIPARGTERNVALGYIRREAAAQGVALNATNAKLVVSPVPFAEFFTQ
jgi:folate-binding protein YgfZ